MPTRQDQKWHCRWICPKCERHGRLAHCDLFFAPYVCSGCGQNESFAKVRMRYEPPTYDYYIGIFPVKQKDGKWFVHEDDKDWNEERYDNN